MGVVILDVRTRKVMRDSISYEHLSTVFEVYKPRVVVCNSPGVKNKVPEGVPVFMYVLNYDSEDGYDMAEDLALRLTNMHFLRKKGHGLRTMVYEKLPTPFFEADEWTTWICCDV